MSTKELSNQMEQALAKAREHNGELVRLPGAFWSYAGCRVVKKLHARHYPDWYANEHTVLGLVRRGLMEVIERSPCGSFAVRARVIDPNERRTETRWEVFKMIGVKRKARVGEVLAIHRTDALTKAILTFPDDIQMEKTYSGFYVQRVT